VQCNDLFYLPSLSRTLQLNLSLPASRTVTSDSALLSMVHTLPLGSISDRDTQLVIRTQDSGTGAMDPPFTLVIRQKALTPIPQDSTWSAHFCFHDGSCAASVTQASSMVARNITKPASFGSRPFVLNWTLPEGAQLYTARGHRVFNLTMPLPGRVLPLSYYTVLANGSFGESVRFFVAAEPFLLLDLALSTQTGAPLSPFPPFSSAIGSYNYAVTLPFAARGFVLSFIVPSALVGQTFHVRSDGLDQFSGTVSATNMVVPLTMGNRAAASTQYELVMQTPVGDLLAYAVTLYTIPVSVQLITLEADDPRRPIDLDPPFDPLELEYTVLVDPALPVQTLYIDVTTGIGDVIAISRDGPGDWESTATIELPPTGGTTVILIHSMQQQSNYTITLTNPATFVTTVQLRGSQGCCSRPDVALPFAPAAELDTLTYAAAFNSSSELVLSDESVTGSQAQLLVRFSLAPDILFALYWDGTPVPLPPSEDNLPLALSLRSGGNTELIFVTAQGQYSFTVSNPPPRVRSLTLHMGGGAAQWPLVEVPLAGGSFSSFRSTYGQQADFVLPLGCTRLLLRMDLTATTRVDLFVQGVLMSLETVSPSATAELELPFSATSDSLVLHIYAPEVLPYYWITLYPRPVELTTAHSLSMNVSGLPGLAAKQLFAPMTLQPFAAQPQQLSYTLPAAFPKATFWFTLSPNDTLTFALDSNWTSVRTAERNYTSTSGDGMPFTMPLQAGRTNLLTLRSRLLGEFNISVSVPLPAIQTLTLISGTPILPLTPPVFSLATREYSASMPATENSIYVIVDPPPAANLPFLVYASGNLELSTYVSSSNGFLYVVRNQLLQGEINTLVLKTPEGDYMVQLMVEVPPFATVQGLRMVATGLPMRPDESLSFTPALSPIKRSYVAWQLTRAYPLVNVSLEVLAGDSVTLDCTDCAAVTFAQAGAHSALFPLSYSAARSILLVSAVQGSYVFQVPSPMFQLLDVRIRADNDADAQWGAPFHSEVFAYPDVLVPLSAVSWSFTASFNPNSNVNDVHVLVDGQDDGLPSIAPRTFVVPVPGSNAPRNWTVTVETRDALYRFGVRMAPSVLQVLWIQPLSGGIPTGGALPTVPEWDGLQTVLAVTVPADCTGLQLMGAFSLSSPAGATVLTSLGSQTRTLTASQAVATVFLNRIVSTLLLNSTADSKLYNITVRVYVPPFATVQGLRMTATGLPMRPDVSLSFTPALSPTERSYAAAPLARAYPFVNVSLEVLAGDSVTLSCTGCTAVTFTQAGVHSALMPLTLVTRSIELVSAVRGRYAFNVSTPMFQLQDMRIRAGDVNAQWGAPFRSEVFAYTDVLVPLSAASWSFAAYFNPNSDINDVHVLVDGQDDGLDATMSRTFTVPAGSSALRNWNVTVETRDGLYNFDVRMAPPVLQGLRIQPLSGGVPTGDEVLTSPLWDGVQTLLFVTVPADCRALQLTASFSASSPAGATVLASLGSQTRTLTSSQAAAVVPVDQVTSTLLLNSTADGLLHTITVQVDVIPIAAITASSQVLTDCDTQLVLDGRQSHWPAVLSGLPPLDYDWRVGSIVAADGVELFDGASPKFNNTRRTMYLRTIDASMLRGAEALPATATLTVISAQMLANTNYTFRLRVGAAFYTKSPPASYTVMRQSAGSGGGGGGIVARIGGVPPSGTLTVNDALVLNATSSYDLACSATPLVYTWSCPRCALPSGVSLSSPTVALQPGWLAAGQTYEWTLTVSSQSNPSRRAVAVTMLNVTVPPSVAAEAGVDPCAGSTLCANGGKCVATAVSGSGSSSAPVSYSLTCACPVSPITFYGPRCTLAVLACPTCVSRYLGGAVVTLYGVGLDSLRSLSVAGRTSTFVPAELADPSTDEQAASVLQSVGQQYAGRLQALRFESPALVTATNTSGNATIPGASRRLLENPRSAYQPLTLVSSLSRGDGSGLPLEMNYTRLLYYSSSSCLSAGEWKEDGLGGCLPCPAGGHCPGAGRVWPLPGWWSWNEYQAPVECIVEEACPGVVDARGTLLSTNADNSGFTQTCGASYTGAACASCAEGAYRLNGRCYPCMQSSDQSGVLALTVIVGLSLMGLLSLAVAFLSAARLAETVQLLLVAQGVALVGVDAARNLPLFRQEVSMMFGYFNFINADIEVLKPGCGGLPDFTYVDKLRLTLLFTLCTAVLFLAGCLLRFIVHRRRRTAVQDAPHRLEPQDEQQVCRRSSMKEDEELSQREGSRSGSMRLAAGTKASDDSAGAASNVSLPLPPLPALLEFRYRCVHAMLILLALFYLRLSILCFKAFRCVAAEDALEDPDAAADDSTAQPNTSLVLAEDMQTLCYTGAHLSAAVGASLLLLLYSAGFPILIFVLLMRAFGEHQHAHGVLGWMRRNCVCLRTAKEKRALSSLRVEQPASEETDGGNERAPALPSAQSWMSDSSSPSSDATAQKYAASDLQALLSARIRQRAREAQYGFLVLEFRPAAYFSLALVLLQQLLFALLSVFVQSPLSLLFGFGLLWSAQLLATLLWLPFKVWRVNAKNVGVSLASLTHSTTLLALQAHGATSALFVVLLLLLLTLVISLVGRERISRAAPWLHMADAALLFRPLRRKAAAALPDDSSSSSPGSDKTGATGPGELVHENSSSATAAVVSPSPVPSPLPPPSPSPAPCVELTAISHATASQGGVDTNNTPPPGEDDSTAAAVASATTETAPLVRVHLEHVTAQPSSETAAPPPGAAVTSAPGTIACIGPVAAIADPSAAAAASTPIVRAPARLTPLSFVASKRSSVSLAPLVRVKTDAVQQQPAADV